MSADLTLKRITPSRYETDYYTRDGIRRRYVAVRAGRAWGLLVERENETLPTLGGAPIFSGDNFLGAYANLREIRAALVEIGRHL